MELTPLRQFAAIARAGHMTRASRELGVTQPALSAMVKKLEEEVGAPLLHRTGRGVELTDAGKIFLEHATAAVRAADAAAAGVRQLTGLERGSIRVGGGATAITYLLPPVISAVRKRHPGLRFYVREAGSNAVSAAVLSGELDLGIVTLPAHLAPSGHARTAGGPSGAAMEKDLELTPLVEDELRLIVPPGGKHPLSGKSSFRWKDLASENVVAFEAGTAVRELVDQSARAAGVELTVVMELRSIESIKQMVAAAIGVGFVSRFALKEGEGLACKDAGGKLARRLAIVRRAGRGMSAAVAEFERELIRRSSSKPRLQ